MEMERVPMTWHFKPSTTGLLPTSENLFEEKKRNLTLKCDINYKHFVSYKNFYVEFYGINTIGHTSPHAESPQRI